MEEEVNQRVVTLSVNTGRMTASVLARTMSYFLAREHQALNRRAEIRKNTEPHGKMTVKELMDQNAGAESVEINKNNIGAFDRVARKYNIDYALSKKPDNDPNKKHTQYLIFFKARDRDVMTQAFKEFVNENSKKQQKQTMKQKLKEYKSLAKELNEKRAKDKHRSQERSL